MSSWALLMLRTWKDPPDFTCKRVLMQGIRAPVPSRLFPITMTASGLSPEDENEQLLPRGQRKLIIKAGLEEKVTSFRSVS